MPPIRKGFENEQVRPLGEFLTPKQVDLVAKAATKIGRHRFRDGQIIRTAYRHGLRASELAHLKRDQVSLDTAEMMIRRLKKGQDMMHPISGEETRAFRKLFRDYGSSPWVFTTERGGPLTPSAIQKIVARAGRRAELPMPIHPHMLRHSCGYKLANDGVDLRTIMDYLGHKTVSQVIKYTKVNPARFRNFFKD
jgi:type 1 fimbriae regulatory protein FimB/type 1 fimbriae regulatory protein FimE